MTVNDAAKANELVTSLESFIEMQEEQLNGLKTALEAYTEFLANEIKEIQNAK